jgi:hypothetical protein
VDERWCNATMRPNPRSVAASVLTTQTATSLLERALGRAGGTQGPQLPDQAVADLFPSGAERIAVLQGMFGDRSGLPRGA